MQGQQFLNAIAALLAWREEAINGINGQLGVLFVLRNRLKAGWSHGDFGQIMEGHNQFSSMSVVGDGQTVHYPDVREPSFNKILQYVDSVFDPDNPLADTLTNGAVYYADLNSPGFQKGGWFDRVILSNPTRFPVVAKIGSTTYFADKGV
jgi:hypothetical protein